MQTRIFVIGGGITGQLFKFYIPSATVLDWRPAPSNGRHLEIRDIGANYLWAPLPDIPCRAFPVITHIDGAPATIESAIAYKRKVGKEHDRSDWTAQFRTPTTGYEPDKPVKVAIQFASPVTHVDAVNQEICIDGQLFVYDYLISTVPLTRLIDMVDIGRPIDPQNLTYRPIFWSDIGRPPDAPYPPRTMYVNYLSDPAVTAYRVTDRGKRRFFESLDADNGARKIVPGKIYGGPSPALIHDLEMRGIFLFGRFGRWSPDELVHETVASILEWRAKYVN